ncbi:TPA: hypothetical protein ACH3X2_008494 [Trebouxia sp. C0005]
MMLKLKARNAVRPQAAHAQMLSITTCRNMLNTLGVDAATLDALAALKPVPPHIRSTITVNPQAAAMASSAPSQHSVSLPAMLPSVDYTLAQLNKRYGLKTSFEPAKVLQLQPLQSQMEAFKAWMTQPINLARGQQKYISITTWHKGFETIIHMYLGFCYHMAGVAQPSLEHFLDGNMYAAYTAFLLQRRIVRSSFEEPCAVGKNVADFFMAKLDVDHSESHTSQRTQLMQYQNWLSALRSQVCEWLPQCAYSIHDPQLILAEAHLELQECCLGSISGRHQSMWTCQG